ncbi:MAG: hypothetical protein ABH854_01680 [Candidatus Diapherotrites archaeon]
MYTKTCTVERPYSKAQIERITELLSELRKARKSESVRAYTRKLMADLKA